MFGRGWSGFEPSLLLHLVPLSAAALRRAASASAAFSKSAFSKSAAAAARPPLPLEIIEALTLIDPGFGFENPGRRRQNRNSDSRRTGKSVENSVRVAWLRPDSQLALVVLPLFLSFLELLTEFQFPLSYGSNRHRYSCKRCRCDRRTCHRRRFSRRSRCHSLYSDATAAPAFVSLGMEPMVPFAFE